MCETILGVAIFLFAPTTQPVPGDIIINEIAYAWPGESLEFVELYNRSTTNYDLAGLSISDDRRVPVRVPEGGASLAPGSFLVLVNRKDLFDNHFGNVDAIEVPSWPTLNNSSDAVVIALDGIVLDSVRYSSAWGGVAGSIERRDPNVLFNTASNWGSSTHPSGATPGFSNTLLQADYTPPYIVAVEEDGPLVLWARSSEPLDPTSLRPEHFRVDGRRPAALAAESDLASFRLALEQPLIEPVLLVEGIRDLSGNQAGKQELVIATIPRRGDLVINEIMFDPRVEPDDGLPDQTEYVELINTSALTLRLHGLVLAEDLDEVGFSGGTPLVTTRASLPPVGIAVLYTLRLPTQTGAQVPLEFEGFGRDAGKDAIWLGAPSITSRGLSNSGQPLRLISPEGRLLDDASYDPSWHSLTLRTLSETRGVSLERIDPYSPGDDGNNWSSSRAMSGGTPGLSNSVLQAGGSLNIDKPGVTAIPSPFSPDDDGYEDVTHFQFRLQNEVSVIRLTIFDVQGRIVRRLRRAEFSSGEGSVLWDGKDDRGLRVPIGIYVALLEGITAETASTEQHKSLVSVAGRR